MNKALKVYFENKDLKVADKHMDGFEEYIKIYIRPEYSLKKDEIINETTYRRKRWDYSIWQGEKLKAVLEFKSLGKSAAKNVNNRMEEAEGCASFIARSFPEVRKGYVLIGESLDEKIVTRWASFFEDSVRAGMYDSFCFILLDSDGYSVYGGLDMRNLLNVLQN